MSTSGDGLVYSTYLGGSDEDFCTSVAVDDWGCAYVTGWVWSTNFPILMAFQGTHQGGLYDAFVTKLNSSGNDLVYSTYLGGSSYDCGIGIAVDGSGCACVSGQTASVDFPLANPHQTHGGGLDGFATKLNSLGYSPFYSTYLGGSAGEMACGIAVDASGCAHVVGWTQSTDFPTVNPFQATYAGSRDAFVAKLSESCCYIRGDINHDGGVDPLDAVYFVNYLWLAGPPPPCTDEADVNGSGGVDPLDAIYLVNYFWNGGPPPVPCP